MTDPMTYLAIGIAYVLGSVPTGYWLGRGFRKIDIREHGSRNIGATNTLRVLGKKLGAVALLGDIAKGVVSVLFVARLSAWDYAPLACGLTAILGHTFSVFLKFRGGKGVATSAGTFLGLAPVPTGIAIATFAVTLAISRMVSLGSILAAVALAVALWVIPNSLPVQIIGTIVAGIVVVRHRDNIKRILAGNESKL
jgi:glycerol-3-phosphate acyltransferase PlsY